MFCYATISVKVNVQIVLAKFTESVSVLDLVDKISELMGKNHIKPTIENSAIGEIHSQYLDSSKAKQMLNWEPNYSLYSLHLQHHYQPNQLHLFLQKLVHH